MSVYACSDLHGRYDLYLKIQEFINPEDQVYFLGDATDRGPQSWETMRAILSNPQWIYLCGNHEDLLIKAMKEYLDTDCNSGAWWSLAGNGGSETFDSWIANGAREGWIIALQNLPTFKEYINPNNQIILLSHAGFTPKGNIKDYIPNRKDILWNREHLQDNWYSENVYVVYGHTPIPFQLYTNREKIDAWELTGSLRTCGGHKINIDGGAYWNGKSILLNLDTLEEVIISV